MSMVFDVQAAQLIRAGRILPDAEWHMPAHVHSLYWEFIYFLQGCGRVETPVSTFLPNRYNLMIYPPGLPHAEWANPQDPESTIFMVITVPAECPQGVYLLLSDRDGKMRWLAESILSEYLAFGRSLLAHTYVQVLLQLVERRWSEVDSVNCDVVDFAIQYVQTHYSLPLSVKQLARLAYVSESYLAHRFRKKTGMSVMRYVRQIRADEATRLLATTTDPIASIAQKVGFSDPLHFSRVFKRLTGCAPSNMRRKQALPGEETERNL